MSLKNKYELKEILGRRLREERVKKGWSIELLAEKLDLSPASLGLVERADRLLSVPKLYLASRLLGVTVDYLLSENEISDNMRAEALLLQCRDLNDEDFKCFLDVMKTLVEYIKTKNSS
jgi:transcriptional regulator with XRE-family HTH domain